MSAIRLRRDGRVVFHGPDYGLRQITLGKYRDGQFVASDDALVAKVLADPRTRDWFAAREANSAWMAWLGNGRIGEQPQIERGGNTERAETREVYRRFYRIVKRLRDSGAPIRVVTTATSSLYAMHGNDRLIRVSDHPEPITRHIDGESAEVSLYPEMSREEMDAAEEKLLSQLP